MARHLWRGTAMCAALALALALASPPAHAQDLRISTPYPSVAVEAGDRVTLDVSVHADTPRMVRLEVAQAPEGWQTTLRGGGFLIGGVYADPEDPPEAELEIDVPADVEEGEHVVALRASDGEAIDELELTLMVDEAVGGELALTTEFPTLRGTADTEFSFDLELDNATPQEHTLALEAVGPQGWQVDASPSGEGTAATVTVEPGDAEAIDVEAIPPPGVVAGTYPIAVRASGGGQRAEVELEVEVTGVFDIRLGTPDDRLSAETRPGGEATIELVVDNPGSADLVDVELSADTPSGWEAAFSPEVVDLVEADDRAEVTMTLTAADDAIVGDYRVTVTAEAPEVADEVDVRVSVETSRAWGAVGIGLILAALGGLGWVFRVFGRR